MTELSKCDIVESAIGKTGGICRLRRSPGEYRVGDILRAAEGQLTPVALSFQGREEV